MLLQANDVEFTYGDALVLAGVDFALREGEFVGLIGPNGAGKSTLLKLLGGLVAPDAGRVDLLGRPLSAYRPRDDDALLLAAAERVDEPVGQMERMGRAQGALGQRPVAVGLDLEAAQVRAAAHEHDLARREWKLQRSRLGHVRD